MQGNIDKIAAGFGFNTQAELMAYLGDLSDPNGNKIFEVDMTSGKLTLNTLIAGSVAVDELFVKNITAPDGLFLKKLAVAEFTAENATFRKFNTRINNNGAGCVMTPDGKFALMGYNSINENTVQLVVDGVGKRPELYLSSYSNNRSARMLLDKIQFANLYGTYVNAEFGVDGITLPNTAKVDISGFLCRMRFNANGSPVNVFGPKAIFRLTGKAGVGRYKVYHNISNELYTPIPIPIVPLDGRNVYLPCLISKGYDSAVGLYYCIIGFSDSTNGYWIDTAFEITINGQN